MGSEVRLETKRGCPHPSRDGRPGGWVSRVPGSDDRMTWTPRQPCIGPETSPAQNRLTVEKEKEETVG